MLDLRQVVSEVHLLQSVDLILGCQVKVWTFTTAGAPETNIRDYVITKSLPHKGACELSTV